MSYPNDTIAAVSTPIGQGGIGIVRISGPGSLEIASRIFRGRRPGELRDTPTYTLHYGHIVKPSDGSVIDEVILSVMRARGSYTREDVVEINCHGGMVPVREILRLVVSLGARAAEPGEFTKRAFLNGRLSLNEAEAVMDLISARTEESRKIALDQLSGGLSGRLSELRDKMIETSAFIEACIDFPEEEIETKTREELLAGLEELQGKIEALSRTYDEARFFREGLSVAIVGRPNVGKSSLLNALLQRNRAIVTELPGTTRDIIEELLNIKGLPVRIVDTAGIRSSEELIEKEGIRRSLEAMEQADFVIALLDGSEETRPEDLEILGMLGQKNALIAINKTDLPSKISLAPVAASGRQYLYISAAAGTGLEELKNTLFDANLRNWKEEREGVVITNVRHKSALERAGAALEKAAEILQEGRPLELFSIEMRQALDSIGEITGAISTEEILERIFSDFCIGK
jgi:tRNA modification GTPase